MTEKIKEQILAVRATGRTNMFDTNMVQVIANEMKFYELVETLRENLKKKVDLLDTKQLNNNPALLNEILKDGIKIYG